jgi:stringent starvation protein B
MSSMTSSRSYLVRALYDWIIDNQCTPYLLVNALHERALVPQDFVNPDGQIVLNISPTAVNDFFMGDSELSFNARFGGVPTEIFVPCAAIMGIYAKENQQGMIFEVEPEIDNPSPSTSSPSGSKHASGSKKRPSLKVVK